MKLSVTSPLISVIIPVYNVEKYLPACLDSVLSQTYKNLEILLIDDGSTDKSSRICKLYASRDARIRLVREKNAGLSGARNKGIGLAKGEYLTFLDSDDFLAPDAIEYLYKLVKKSGAPISVCSHYERKENGGLRDFNSSKLPTRKLSVADALNSMLNERGFMVSAWGKLYSGELFLSPKSLPAIRFSERKLHEDVGTTYRLFLRALALDRAAKIAYGASPKYYYNLRSSSITNSSFNMKKLDLLAQTDTMCAEIDQTLPSLKNATNLRRIHARFSILRQIIQKTHKTEKEKKLEQSLISYIKEHKTWILKNPEATKRDKLAFLSLLLGKPVFKYSWKVYKLFR